MNYKKKFGNDGEEEAVSYLLKLGYLIKERQFTVNQKIGELDIIATKDNIVAFIEVKRRKTDHGISISEIVSVKKQNSIIKMALLYCQKNNMLLHDYVIRFDIIYVLGEKIEHYENAFSPKF